MATHSPRAARGPVLPARRRAAVRAAAAARPGASSSARSDVVTMDRGMYDQMVAAAREGAAVRKAATAGERDRLVNEAVASARIAPARRAAWRASLEADPDGAAAALARLAPGSAMPIGEIGGIPSTDVAESEVHAAALASFGITRKG